MSGKAIKIKRILLNGKMSEKADGRADGAYCFCRIKRGEAFKAHTAALDNNELFGNIG